MLEVVNDISYGERTGRDVRQICFIIFMIDSEAGYLATGAAQVRLGPKFAIRFNKFRLTQLRFPKRFRARSHREPCSSQGARHTSSSQFWLS